MTDVRPIETDLHGARVLQGVIGSAIVDDQGVVTSQRKGYGNPVIVGQANELPCDDEEKPKARRLQTLAGVDWSASDTAVPVRRIGNGRQIAFPVGRYGLCVQDVGFWAVNIQALTAATHFLDGHTTGRAGLFRLDEDGNLVVTDERLDFVNRDTTLTLDDGTPIILGYVSGDLTILWAACNAEPDLEGLDPDPEAP